MAFQTENPTILKSEMSEFDVLLNFFTKSGFFANDIVI